jgi:hypothetical protein
MLMILVMLAVTVGIAVIALEFSEHDNHMYAANLRYMGIDPELFRTHDLSKEFPELNPHVHHRAPVQDSPDIQ